MNKLLAQLSIKEKFSLRQAWPGPAQLNFYKTLILTSIWFTHLLQEPLPAKLSAHALIRHFSKIFHRSHMDTECLCDYEILVILF